MDIKNKQNNPSLPGQSSSLDNGNNPKGIKNLKAQRPTQVNEAGTRYLRGQQNGNN